MKHAQNNLKYIDDKNVDKYMYKIQYVLFHFPLVKPWIVVMITLVVLGGSTVAVSLVWIHYPV